MTKYPDVWSAIKGILQHLLCRRTPRIENYERAMRHASAFLLELRKEIPHRPGLIEELEAISDLLLRALEGEE